MSAKGFMNGSRLWGRVSRVKILKRWFELAELNEMMGKDCGE